MALRVLMYPSPFAPANRAHIGLLAQALPAEVSVTGFRWRRAFFGRYDILHVHWPEHFVGRGVGMKERVRGLAVRLLIQWTRLRRIPRVWTVHNLEPHEGRSPAARRVLRAWERSLDAKAYPHRGSLPDDAGPLHVAIPWGPQWPPSGPDSPSDPDRHGLLNFGLLRPYKGIESLLAAYAGLSEADRPDLTISGVPLDQGYAERIRGLAAPLHGVHLDFGWLESEVLAGLIRRARLVVLPYDRIYNSGVVLDVLARRRPVLVPDSETMRDLRDEVGADWVMLFEELTPESLRDAYARAGESIRRSGMPDLSRREWAAIGEAYAEWYAAVLAARGRGGGSGSRSSAFARPNSASSPAPNHGESNQESTRFMPIAKTAAVISAGPRTEA